MLPSFTSFPFLFAFLFSLLIAIHDCKLYVTQSNKLLLLVRNSVNLGFWSYQFGPTTFALVYLKTGFYAIQT